MEQDLTSILSGGRNARIVIVAAHADDEIIGAGVRLRYLQPTTIIHVTDGAPRNMADASRYGFHSRGKYAQQRRLELKCALRQAGVSPECIELGVPDQEATVNTMRIAKRLSELFHEIQPDIVLTHAYEGGHPDHDACAFAVHTAAGQRTIVEFTSYHISNGQIRTGEFLGRQDDVITFELSEQQRERKRRMLACFATQSETLAQFSTDCEKFRIAPRYAFDRPPHEGTLYYEMFPWGMTGERFRHIVRLAAQEMETAN